MSDHHEYEGRVYCDWRLSVTGCEESEFFWGLTVYALSAEAFVTLIFIVCFLIRKFVSQDPWGSFRKGESLVLSIIIFINLLYALQKVSVLFEFPHPAPGILWAMTYLPRFLIILITYDILVKAIPKSAINRESFLTDKKRELFLTIYYIIFTLLHGILLTLAYIYSAEGNLQLGRNLERAGLTITSILLFFTAFFFFFSLLSLKRSLEEVINEAGKISKDRFEIDLSLLKIAHQKVTQSVYSSTFINTMEMLYFILLAQHPHFFTLLPLSKAFAILNLVFLPTTSVLYGLSQIANDTKKGLVVIEVKRRPSTTRATGSRKEDSNLETSKTSFSKDHVEHSLTELKSSSPA